VIFFAGGSVVLLFVACAGSLGWDFIERRLIFAEGCGLGGISGHSKSWMAQFMPGSEVRT
jgi:hypothetical protein